MPGHSIDILGKSVGIDFEVGEGATAADLDQPLLVAEVQEMAALINAIDWPPHYASAFREMNRIVFFEGKVMVDGYKMDRPCCDQDAAIFYWEANEFLKNRDADVHANTYFHDCWHVVQFKHTGTYAYTEDEQVLREVDAVTHQIGVAHMLGCSPHEVAHLEKFRSDHDEIAARLDEGVGRLTPHRPGAMSAHA